MAVAQGYGKTITSGSVFAYDVADTRNSYIGEPTTNQYTNPDFTNGTTGWSFGSWDGNVTYGTDNVVGPFGKTIPVLKLTKNATSAYSHFHQDNSGKYTTGNQYTLSAWVKGSGTFRGNTQWGGIEQSFSLTGDWQYIKYTVTAPNNSNYPYWAAEALTTGTVMYMAYAQSEQKSHATPFTTGTRSATQGLLPLVGNSTIDLSNVSFDSNAQMTFDGTNDYINIPSSNVFDTQTVTVEVIVKPYSTSQNGFWFEKGAVNTQYSLFMEGSNIVWRTAYGVTLDSMYFGSSNMTANAWNHVVGTYTAGDKRVYLNSTLMNSNGLNVTLNTNQGNQYIGSYNSNGYFYNGEIAVVKVYNRALTAGEVRQNYLHYKTRFNLS